MYQRCPQRGVFVGCGSTRRFGPSCEAERRYGRCVRARHRDAGWWPHGAGGWPPVMESALRRAVGDAVSRWDRRSGSAHGLPVCFRRAPRRLGGRRGEIAERLGVLRCEQHLHQVIRWRGSVGRRRRGRRSCAAALLVASAAPLTDIVVSFEEPPHAASAPASTSGVPLRARRLLRQRCLARTFTHASENLLKFACVAERHHRCRGFAVTTRDDLGAISHGGGGVAPAPGCGQMVKFRLSGVSPSGLRLRFVQRSLEDDHGY